MELNTDLTQLTSLPLDAGLFAARRSAPATNDDANSFRQHLESPRGRDDQESATDSAADDKSVARRDRPERAQRSSTKRDDKKIAMKDDAPSIDDAAPVESSRPASQKSEDDSTTDATDSASVEPTECGDNLKDKESAEAEAIVAEVAAIAAAPVAPLVIEVPVVEEAAVQAPAIESAAKSTPATPSLPVQANAAASVATQFESDAASADSAEPAAEAKPEEVAAEVKAQKSESNEQSAQALDQANGESDDAAGIRDIEASNRDEATETAAAANQVEVESAESEHGRNDSQDDRPRKSSKTTSSTEPAPPIAESTQPHANASPTAINHPVPQVIAAAAASVATGAEKVATSTSPSAGPRGVGSVESAAPQRLPQHLVGKPSEATGSEPKLTEVEQVRLLQRVARAFQSASQRDGEIRLRLSPPELGALKLDIKVQDGVMNARVEAETQAAQKILLDNLPALRERLAEQNIRIDQFEVGLQGRQSQGQPESRDSQPGSNGSRGGLAGREREVGTASETSQPAVRHHDGKLNVFI